MARDQRPRVILAARMSIPWPYYYKQLLLVTYLLIGSWLNRESWIQQGHFGIYKAIMDFAIAIMGRPLWALLHLSYRIGLHL